MAAGQAVRLPKEFRMPGKEVRVSREGDRVILEPVQPPFDVAAWRAMLDSMAPDGFLDDVAIDDPPVQPDSSIRFD